MGDILFRTESYVFSYRVAGICVWENKILLQKPVNDDGFAFPGGHAALGETNAQTLIREFQEELGANISVGPLRWVGEIFFPWGDKPCHQICLYYTVYLTDQHTPRSGVFPAKECPKDKGAQLEFHWVPLKDLDTIHVYPTTTAQLLGAPEDVVQHFIDRE